MFVKKLSIKVPVTALIWSFSNDDGEGNENAKKAIGLLSKTTTLHVITLFCTFLCCHCTTST